MAYKSSTPGTAKILMDMVIGLTLFTLFVSSVWYGDEEEGYNEEDDLQREWVGDAPMDPGITRPDPEGLERAENPRRPLPPTPIPEYHITLPDEITDSFGTAFAIDRDGIWLTAVHVTHDCARMALQRSGKIAMIRKVKESTGVDATLIPTGPEAAGALPLANRAPEIGERGWHMGYPKGQPGVVASRYMGPARARNSVEAGDQRDIDVWADEAGLPAEIPVLSGMSGGPVLLSDGRVAGVNSASSERRGRIMTTRSTGLLHLVRSEQSYDERPPVHAPVSLADASALMLTLMQRGIITQIYCDVDQ